ncbi:MULTISPECIES: hypothetical protein [Phenylobacterium]|uniref:Uncharacterized protein n=1 Tax=Phenylobacterium koreense TaxID=266125 RepID=A0ABV2EF30_9CAUL
MAGPRRWVDMRTIFLSVSLLALSAGASSAQVPYGSVVTDPAYMAQQQIDRQRAIALENQLNTLDARIQSEQRLREFEAAQPPPRLSAPERPAPNVSGAYATIPDSVLADSNARVRAASKNPR